jgi:hypothetical protein
MSWAVGGFSRFAWLGNNAFAISTRVFSAGDCELIFTTGRELIKIELQKWFNFSLFPFKSLLCQNIEWIEGGGLLFVELCIRPQPTLSPCVISFVF